MTAHANGNRKVIVYVDLQTSQWTVTDFALNLDRGFDIKQMVLLSGSELVVCAEKHMRDKEGVNWTELDFYKILMR